jgi:lysozyme family protein
MLAAAEKYNGLGYRNHGILSGYVVAYTNMSNELGGYPRDHVWDSKYVHDRPSVGAILIRMQEIGLIQFIK